MPGRRVSRRSRFLGVGEGKSERAFATWLHRLCDGVGLRLHFDITIADGGDTRAIVEHAVEQREKRNRTRIRDTGALVFLDADRVQADRGSERGPGQGDLRLVWLKPNLEGVLVRLHNGNEALRLQPNEARSRPRQVSPDYEIPTSADWLSGKFSLDDLRRAARHDRGLSAVPDLLGSGTPPS